MAYGELNGHITLKGQGRDLSMFGAQYLRIGNSGAPTTGNGWLAMK